MSDLVERLRAEASFHGVPNSLEAEAADEIERLLGACKDKADLLKDAYAQIERLEAQIRQHIRNAEEDTAEMVLLHAEIERLRELCQGLGRIQHANEETCGKAATEIERLHTDCDRLREFNTRLCAEVERLGAALESLTRDPPATLDEPDTDAEVIIKMRAIVRAALDEASR